jgi:4a-hydroxytetrahydrobiopterin dehydratase
MVEKASGGGGMNGGLASKRCIPCEGGVAPLGEAEIDRLLGQVPDWKRVGSVIGREFRFGGYLQTIAFVNAVAWVAERENHHPDLEVGYNRCLVRFSTHSIGGLSENDFILAAKIDALA